MAGDRHVSGRRDADTESHAVAVNTRNDGNRAVMDGIQHALNGCDQGGNLALGERLTKPSDIDTSAKRVPTPSQHDGLVLRVLPQLPESLGQSRHHLRIQGIVCLLSAQPDNGNTLTAGNLNMLRHL